LENCDLAMLTWKPCTIPESVRFLKTQSDDRNDLLAGLYKDQVFGHLIKYVPPVEVLQRAVNLLVAPLRNVTTRYTTSRVYVSGPTGSGKSRLGWEVYREVDCKKREYDLVNVAFVSINMAKNTNIKTVADLVQHLLRTRATVDGVTELNAVQTHRLTLGAVARHLSGWKRGGDRTALVLHIDEFQHNPATVLLIQDAIAAVNEADFFILPICTGLYNKGFHEHKDLDASDHSRAIYLGYLSAANGAADHDAAWKVVRNAVVSVRGQDVLPKTLKEAPPVLRYLVEDLGGWPMAAVQLGGQLAAQEPLKKATSSADVVWDDVQLLVCEDRMDNILNTRYYESATSLGSTLKASGIYKLVTLILSPFPVRLHEDRGRRWVEGHHGQETFPFTHSP
jgi:Cdc6-like AAA superfamily ATPase